MKYDPVCDRLGPVFHLHPSRWCLYLAHCTAGAVQNAIIRHLLIAIINIEIVLGPRWGAHNATQNFKPLGKRVPICNPLSPLASHFRHLRRFISPVTGQFLPLCIVFHDVVTGFDTTVACNGQTDAITCDCVWLPVTSHCCIETSDNTTPWSI